MSKSSFFLPNKPENIFVVIAVIFGILFLLITPPFQVADEYKHFYRSFHVSEGHAMAERLENEFGGFLPESLVFTSKNVSTNIKFNPQGKQKLQDVFALLKLPIENKKRIFVNFSAVAKYSPLPYLPQACGIVAGRMLGFSPLLLMYLGRIFNLLFFVFIIYLSIKIVPIFKWVFSLISLTPMSLSLASSLSADCFTNCISILLTCVLIKCACQKSEKFKRTDLGIIFFIAFLLCLSKPPYQSLILLFLLIPTRKVGNKKMYFMTFTFLSLMSIATSLVMFYLIRDLSNFSYSSVVEQSTVKQLSFLFAHPFVFVSAFFKGWSRDGLQIMDQFVGKLGWLDTELPQAYTKSYIGILALVSLVSGQKGVIISSTQKVVIFVTLAFNVLMISFLLYLHWTAVGGMTLEGWQGRYLIPIAPLLFLLLYNQKLQIQESILYLLIAYYSVFSGALTVFVLIYRYYL